APKQKKAEITFEYEKIRGPQHRLDFPEIEIGILAHYPPGQTIECIDSQIGWMPGREPDVVRKTVSESFRPLSPAQDRVLKPMIAAQPGDPTHLGGHEDDLEARPPVCIRQVVKARPALGWIVMAAQQRHPPGGARGLLRGNGRFIHAR